ncbi:50S ribosomal protein L6 [Buchnera aphidicola (Cinara tujafilina)]|uniref:50S ribosomal protein L6 n=1 Tax=Buchnera aphidicola (Cinara tujafilina) TaxID=261317 RepID=F7WZN5_9GAMM|nr:50S ribosomal protein L6 [Buchnera aphidicola]AEH39902.1 50S ribosomal protein L6 [Buchnera aphidicola (Cinara tujafilina)]
MSRVAKLPINIPKSISISLSDIPVITITGHLGLLKYRIHKCIKINYKKNMLFVTHNHISESYGWMQAGTCRSILQNMIFGVTNGYTKKLQLFGVGYRVTLEHTNILKLFLGFSHPIIYYLPKYITVDVLSNTELSLTGVNKQLVGQVAANIRAYRVPEPYKGKGIRYFHEKVIIKEAKKK